MRNFLLVLLAFIAIPSIGFSQVGEDELRLEQLRLMHMNRLGIRARLSMTSHSESTILNRLTADNVDLIADVELLSSQRDTLKKIIKDFQSKAEGLSQNERFELVRNTVDEIKELLLPEQLESIARFTKSSYRVWPFVLSSKMSEILGLSEPQRRSIQKDCEDADESLESAKAKISKIVSQERERVKKILDRLNDQQRDKLKRILGTTDLNKYFDRLSLDQLAKHVELID